MGCSTGALPDFPWDTLAPFAERARAHPDGIVDLSVGTPVDPTPAVVREALRRGDGRARLPADRTARPTLREAIVDWFARRRGVRGPRPGATCCRRSAPRSSSPACRRCSVSARATSSCIPRAAYPTYDVGARLAGATPVPRRRPGELARRRRRRRLVWLNSPGNPDGRVLGVDAARARSSRWAARSDGAVVVASDECYAELGWDEPWDARRACRASSTRA